MNAGARTASTGPRAAVGAGDGPGGSADAAGRLLGRLTVLPALLVMAWLLAGLPLLLLGRFTPGLMLVISVPLAAGLAVFGLRWIPGRWPGPLPVPRAESAATPWWAVVALVVVAVAFGVDQMIYHSQQIIVMRDPASYVQFGDWIARHGSLPIPRDSAAFGGAQHGLRLHFDSSAFYQAGGAIVPQFMAGLPMILAGGFWVGGVGAAVAMAPLLGACGVLTFGGLVARLVGPRWAPLGGLALALTLPEQFISRSTYSEPVAQILFLGGLGLVIDSLRTEGIGARVMAALGGIALGLTLLVRIDGASDMLPLIPYCGLLLVGRRRQAVPLLAGVVGGAAYGVLDGVVLSRPYLASIRTSLIPLTAAGAAVLLATAAAVALRWRHGLPQVRRAWLPNAAAALIFAVMLGFLVRPYLQTVHGHMTPEDLRVMAGFQRADHLPVDPSRLYYEISLHWVFWYIGAPAVVLGTLGAAVLARRCLRGQAPTWTLPLMTFGWIIVMTLYRPAITPDQPWASRRLVTAVLPGFIVLAIWVSGWLAGWLRRRGVRRLAVGGLVTLCAAALVLPAAITTFGLRLQDGGPLGVEPVAVGLADKATYGGEIAAVSRLCAAIPADSSVVFVDAASANRLAEVVRGMCGVPVTHLSHARLPAVRRIAGGIRQAGRRPVLLAGRPSLLAGLGGRPRLIMALRSTGDEHPLTAAPTGTQVLKITVWMSELSR